MDNDSISIFKHDHPFLTFGKTNEQIAKMIQLESGTSAIAHEITNLGSNVEKPKIGFISGKIEGGKKSS